MFGDMKETPMGWYLYGQMNIFQNEELGWCKTQKKQEMVDGVMTDMEVENTNPEFIYKSMAFFPTTNCGERMQEEILPYIKVDVVVYAYFLGYLNSKEETYKGKTSTKFNMNVDDYIWMQG